MLSDFAIPVMLMTHDRVESMALRDLIVVMDKGQVLQRGSVAQVFGYPDSAIECSRWCSTDTRVDVTEITYVGRTG